MRALEIEYNLLSSFEHKNIVSYYGMERTDNNINIFLEYVGGIYILYKDIRRVTNFRFEEVWTIRGKSNKIVCQINSRWTRLPS